MRRESHVRFREGGGVKSPSATRLVFVPTGDSCLEATPMPAGRMLDRYVLRAAAGGPGAHRGISGRE